MRSEIVAWGRSWVGDKQNAENKQFDDRMMASDKARERLAGTYLLFKWATRQH